MPHRARGRWKEGNYRERRSEEGNELGGRGWGVVGTDVFWADEGVQYY